MGMPEQKPHVGMNIAPDGTIYEVLKDGTIRRIGVISSDGEFESFGEQKNDFKVRNSVLYRIINGKEQKIGRVMPNGEIETVNQRIKNEAEISRNKVKKLTIVSILIAFVIAVVAGIYVFEEEQEVKEQRAREAKIAAEKQMKDEEYENKIKPIYQDYLNETSPKVEKLDSYIKQLNDILELHELKYDENKDEVNKIVTKIKEKKAEILLEEKKKAEEERKKKEEYEKKIKPVYSEYQGKTSPKISDLESYISRLNTLKSELKYAENRQKAADIIRKIEQRKREAEAAKKAEEDRRRREAEAKKAEEDRRRREAEAKKAKQEEYLKGRRVGGLIWSDRSSETMNWNVAKQYCANLVEGSFTDWRLPTISELRKLIKNCYSQSGGSCRISDNCLSRDCDTACCCGGNKGSYYNKLTNQDAEILWSSSTFSDNADAAWVVLFLNEDYDIGKKGVHLHGYKKSGSTFFVRCVR